MTEAERKAVCNTAVAHEQRNRLGGVDGRTAAEFAPEQQEIALTHSRSELPGDLDGIVMTYTSRQNAVDVDEERFLRLWHGKIECTDDNGEPTHEVGYVLAYTVATDNIADPFLLLDDATADLKHIAGVLFDGRTGELREDLADQLELLGDGMLIIDAVHLEPAWRGHGLGLLVAGMAIEHLGEGRQFVALQAGPAQRRNSAGQVVDEITEAERAAAVEKLGKLWEQLGFDFVEDGLGVLDLNSTTFADRMAEHRKRLGLA